MTYWIRRNSDVFCVCCILLLGLTVRLVGLGSQSIWIDEAFSIHASQQELMHVLKMHDPTPPLYYICLHFWIKLFGNDLAMVRSLSALFGTLTIFATYGVASRLLNKRTALLATLLLALSPINIYISQLARTYTLLSFFSVLSMYLYLKLLEKRTRWVTLFYVVCNVLLVYSHVFAWFVVISQNLHFLWRSRWSLFSKERWWIGAQIFPAILFLFWFVPYMRACSYHSWLTEVSLLALPVNLVVGLEESALSVIIILPVLALLILKRSRQGLLYLWLLLPVVLPVIISIFIIPIFTAKYVFYISIPGIVLLAHALLSLKRNVLFATLAIFLGAGCAIHQQTRANHDPWNHVADYVESIRGDQPILFVKHYEKLPFRYYFNRRSFNATGDRNDGIIGIEKAEEIEAFSGQDLILITSRFNPESPEEKAILDQCTSHRETVYSKTFTIESAKRYGNQITVRQLDWR